MRSLAIVLAATLSIPSLGAAQDDEPFLPGLNEVESEQAFQLFLKASAFAVVAAEWHAQRGVFSENAFEYQPLLNRLQMVITVETEADVGASVGRAFWVGAESDTEGTLLHLHTPPDGDGQILTIVAKRPGVPAECAVAVRRARGRQRPSPLPGWDVEARCTNNRNGRVVQTDQMLGFFIPMLKGGGR